MTKAKSFIQKGMMIMSVLLGVTLLIRIVDQAKIIKYFPLGTINDIASYMAQLFFLDACGFHKFCDYWYNGFTAFLFTPPGWYFFAYPFLKLFGDVKIAAYVTILLMLVLGYMLIYYFGKKRGWSIQQRVFLFLCIFANAVAIRGFVRSGRPHEMFAWLAFLATFFIVLHYKNKKIDRKFYLAAGTYAISIISYVAVGIFTTIVFGSLFLIKKGREKIHTIIVPAIGVILSSFWLLPYFTNIEQSSLLASHQGAWLIAFGSDILLKQMGAIVFPVGFIVMFYWFWKSNRERQELIFYSPWLILALLFALRITGMIPILKEIFPNPYFTLFIIVASYLFVETKWGEKSLDKLMVIGSIGIVIASCILVLFFTAYFEMPSQNAKDVIALVPKIEGKYLTVGFPPDAYDKALVSYAAVYYGKKTPFGFYYHVVPTTYTSEVAEAMEGIARGDCEVWKQQSEKLGIEEAISYRFCEQLSACGMKKKEESGNFCLYTWKGA